MRFNNEDDDEKDDFFDGPDLPDKEPKEKKPVYTPDNPRYWEQEESEWEHLKPARRSRIVWWLAGAGAVVVVILVMWLRYLSPCETNAVQYGYIDHISKQGTVFKTWEGVMIPYKEIMDTTRIYKRDFIFTAATDQLGEILSKQARNGRALRVEYKRYHATVPWRGSSKIVVTRVDTVNPRTILPPEYNPFIGGK